MRSLSMMLAAGLIATTAGCGASDDTEVVDANSVGTAVPADAGSGTSTSAPLPSTPVEPAGVPIKVGEGTLVAPNDFQMAVAFYQVVGLQPPIDEWAKADSRTRSANEFDRPAVGERVQQELLLAAQSVAGIGFVELNTRSSFGEYDMAAQGFRLGDVDSSQFYSWNHEGARYKLTLENGNGASLWKVPPDQARQIVETLPYRSVNLKLRIKIVGAMPEGRGGTLKGKIVGYEVFSNDDRKLGGMVFS